jgi:hypothetical protein
MRSRQYERLDLTAFDAGGFEHVVDGRERQAAIALAAGQPLLLDGGEQLVIAKQRCGTVMRSGMERENQHWRVFGKDPG